jgi:tetratricopeptide (TPR) repeat protein
VKKTLFHLSASLCILLASLCLLRADEPSPPVEEAPLKQILTAAQRIQEPFTRLETLLEVADAYTTCNEYANAKDILAGVMQQAERIRNATFKSILLSELADGYAAIGGEERALSLARQIPFPDARDDAIGGIAAGYVRQGKYERALRAIEGIDEPYARALALYTVIKSTRGVSPGVVHEAEEIIKHSSKETRNFIRVISIGELAKFNSRPAAHFTISDDPFRRYKKLVFFAERYIASQSNEKALQVLRAAVHAAKDIKSPLTRNAALGRCAIDYATTGEFEKALALTQGLESDYVKIWALSRIIIHYYNAGKEEEGLSLLVSIAPAQVKNRVCYFLARAYARVSEFKKALEVLAMITDGPVKFKALLVVAKNMQGNSGIGAETSGLFSRELSLLDTAR